MLTAGCAVKRGAPVVDRAPPAKAAAPAKPAAAAKPAARPADTRPEFYTVRKGDTLYSIALDQGLDYRELAQWNGITDPAAIRAGQPLRLSAPPQAAAVTAPLKTAPGVVAQPLDGAPAAPAAAGVEGVKTQPKAVRVPYSDQAYAQLANLKPEPVPAKTDPSPSPGRDDDNIEWAWPANGKVISTFNGGTNFKGISIAGRLGQPVLASAPGRVIFSGTGIRGFGKLIVIKHNSIFLSVYANNSKLLVKEGETISQGQKIAEMGNTDADEVKLYFEIRRFGKPVDPLKLLPPA